MVGKLFKLFSLVVAATGLTAHAYMDGNFTGNGVYYLPNFGTYRYNLDLYNGQSSGTLAVWTPNLSTQHQIWQLVQKSQDSNGNPCVLIINNGTGTMVGDSAASGQQLSAGLPMNATDINRFQWCIIEAPEDEYNLPFVFQNVATQRIFGCDSDGAPATNNKPVKSYQLASPQYSSPQQRWQIFRLN